MSGRKGGGGGLGSFLALIAIGLIIAGVVLAVQDNDKKAKKAEETTPKPNPYSHLEGLDLGDGNLKSASSVKSTEFKKGVVSKGPLVKTSSRSSGKSSSSSSS